MDQQGKPVQLQDKEPQEAKRRTWTLPRTKRASSTNLHNHPTITHPVGIAIWLLQKIDQAHTSTDGERSEPTSTAASPGAGFSNWEASTPGPRVGTNDSSLPFSGKPPTLTGAQPVWGQVNSPHDAEDDLARREAQRQRKTKQRTENWAKNKENDVVARAKLEAKKRFGLAADKEQERTDYTNRRVQDDFDRLLSRQTASFADALAVLPPFQVGFGDTYASRGRNAYDPARGPVAEAARLLLNVLPALAENQVSDRSRHATHALLRSLSYGHPPADAFFHVIDALSEEDNLLEGIDKVIGTLMQRSDDRRMANRRGPYGDRSNSNQSVPSFFGTSPHPAVPSRFTWKEPATLNNNNFSSAPASATPRSAPSTPAALASPAPFQAQYAPNSGLLRPPQVRAWNSTPPLDPALATPAPQVISALHQTPTPQGFSLQSTFPRPVPPPNSLAPPIAPPYSAITAPPPTPLRAPAAIGAPPSAIILPSTHTTLLQNPRPPATSLPVPLAASALPTTATSAKEVAASSASSVGPNNSEVTLAPPRAPLVTRSMTAPVLLATPAAQVPTNIQGLQASPEPPILRVTERAEVPLVSTRQEIQAAAHGSSTPITSTTSPPSPSNFTPPTAMRPPNSVQFRSSGRERKPTAKILAAAPEPPSRPLATSPSLSAVPPNLTRSLRSSPRVPSKLGLFESISDHADTDEKLPSRQQHGSPSAFTTQSFGHSRSSLPSIPGNNVNDKAVSPANNASTSAVHGQQRLENPPSKLPVPHLFPPPNYLPALSRLDVQHGLDPQLTFNLLRLAKLAAEMSDSEDDPDEEDSPYHAGLARILHAQYEATKRQISSSEIAKEATNLVGAVVDFRQPESPAASNSSSRGPTPNEQLPLPPVNTIMSAREAQAASTLFKQMAADGAALSTAEPTTSNMDTSQREDVGVENGVSPQSENRVVRTPTSDMGTLNHSHSPQLLATRASFSTYALTAPSSHQALGGLTTDKKRKFDDENAGLEIALKRLRTAAQVRGLAVDPRMTFPQLEEIIDRHDASFGHHNHESDHYQAGLLSGLNAVWTTTNGNTASSLPNETHSPTAASGLRPLVSNGFLAVNSMYNLLPPETGPTTLAPPSNHPLPDIQEASVSQSKENPQLALHFLPPNQSRQSKRISATWTRSPSTPDGDDSMVPYNTLALNGGPPGGGAIINTKDRQDARMRRGGKAADYKLHVKGSGKNTPLAPVQPKKGGQLISFGQA